MKTLLLSGGLDSALILWTEKIERAIFVDYGQKSGEGEKNAAMQLAKRRGVDFRIIDVMTMRGDPVVPHRNAVMLSAAASDIETGVIYFGANSDDYTLFRDCRPEFIHAMNNALGPSVRVVAPLLLMSKKEVAEKAREVGVPIDLTWSCYRRGSTQCGECLACKERNKALRATMEKYQ